MSNRDRKRVGFNAATSESARRQLMQPVQCWEKVWVTPSQAPSGSTLKVFKWVKTDKKQNFSDDEEEVDEPLAPIPDDVEVIEADNEGDDEMDQDEPTAAAEVEPETEAPSAAASEPPAQDDEDIDESGGPSQLDSATQEETQFSLSLPTHTSPSIPSSRQIDPLGLPGSDDNDVDVSDLDAATFAASLEQMDEATVQALGDSITEADLGALDEEGMMSLDMAVLGPDGTQLEGASDLTQLQEGDDVFGGGEIMDETGDPFK